MSCRLVTSTALIMQYLFLSSPSPCKSFASEFCAYLFYGRLGPHKPSRILQMIKAMRLSFAVPKKVSSMSSRNCSPSTEAISGVDVRLEITSWYLLFSVLGIFAWALTIQTIHLSESMLSACNLQVDPSISCSELVTRRIDLDLGNLEPISQ